MATSHSPVDIDVSMPPPGLGDCMLREPGTGRKFPLSELWATQPCFIHFLRRFGCPLCQKGAQDLSQLKAELDRLNVRMVAIGFEDESYPQFAEGSFWAGDLFFDDNRQTYSLLGFKRQNAVKGFTSLFSASVWRSYRDARQAGISGNMKGDGMQLGGNVVVGVGGTQLHLHYPQQSFTDFPSSEQVLEAARRAAAETGSVAPGGAPAMGVGRRAEEEVPVL